MAEQCTALSLFDADAGELTDWAERLAADYVDDGLFGGAGEPDESLYEREGVDPSAVDERTQRRLQRAARARESLGLPVQCPHQAHSNDGDRCIFHLSAGQRERHDITPAEIESAFRSRIADPDDDGANQKAFVRCEFPRLDLTHALVDTFDNQPIDLRFAHIGGLRLDDARLKDHVRFDGAIIEACSCRAAHFEEGASFTGATLVGDPISFRDSRFGSPVDFSDAAFEAGQLRFDGVRFGDAVDFSRATFTIDVQAAEARKRRGARRVDVTFQKAVFAGDATFQDVSLRGDDGETEVGLQVHFRRCQARGTEMNFKQATFGQARETAGIFGDQPERSITVDEVSFRGADFAGCDLDFTAATVGGDLDVENADLTGGRSEFNLVEVGGSLSFQESDFSDGEVFFNGLDVAEAADYTRAKFSRNAVVRFTDAAFGGALTFEKAIVEDGDVDFSGITVDADADFANARFSGEEVDFVDAELRGDLRFDDARIAVQAVRFGQLSVGGAASFSNVEFECNGLHFTEATVEGPVAFDRARIDGDAVDWADVRFSGPVTFAGAEFSGDISFAGAALLGEELDFSDVEAHDAALNFVATETATPSDEAETPIVDLSGAVVLDGAFTQPADSRTYYDFTEATVGDLSLRFSGARDGNESIFAYFRFQETEFRGFDFSDSAYRRDLKSNSWRIHTFAIDPDEGSSRPQGLARVGALAKKYVRLAWDGPDPTFAPDVLESTYRKARIGADREGDSAAASKFFQKELGYRRQGHGYYAWRRGGEGPDESSRLKRAWFWLTNATLWLISGYGERPWRVIFASLSVVGVFTVMYRATWWYLGVLPPETARGFVGSLLLSAEMFTAIILGGGEVNHTLIRGISYVEGFIGSMFIALFVLTITRAIRR